MINFTVKAYLYSISANEIIKDGNPKNYIYDLEETGIKMNDFKSPLLSDCIEVVLWINPVKETVTMQYFGVDKSGEKYCDEAEDFSIRPEDIKALLEYEKTLHDSVR